MSSFEAVFLHGVVPYRRAASLPEAPDFKSLQKRLGDAVSSLDRSMYDEGGPDVSDIEDCKDIISNTKSDYDFGDELEVFIHNSDTVITSLHEHLREASRLFEEQWDPDSMTREEMIEFISGVRETIDEFRPDSKSLSALAGDGYFMHLVGSMINGYHFLKHARMCYTTADNFSTTLFSDKAGACQVTAYQDGILKFDLHWKKGTLTFTRDEKIVMVGKDDSTPTFAMKLWDFRNHFDKWWQPTEEEIMMFQTLYPLADFSVIRYLKEYELEKYLVSVDKLA